MGDAFSAAELLAVLCGKPTKRKRAPRFLVVGAHPDDEIIGLGTRLPLLAEVTLARITDGSPLNPHDARAAGFKSREEYARARHAELIAALSLAGIGAERTRELGYSDQEAARHLVGLTKKITALIAKEKPDAVVTHPYEGGHPDHDAAAFGVHYAAPPVHLEFASYHSIGGKFEAGVFLPNRRNAVKEVILTAAERKLKKKMFGCFVSQRKVLKIFPVDAERFREAPLYDFSEPPHEGPVHYDAYDWGLKSGEWLKLARAAIATLAKSSRPKRGF